MRHQVRDGIRKLEFDGELLASSSSFKPDRYRWVEFELYLTVSGTYILGRIGRSLLFHTETCSIVERNHLKPSPDDILTDAHVPCEQCQPYDDDDIIVEKPRFFAMVSDSPEAILETLHKYDKQGARYLTYVAQRLIEDAAKLDNRLDSAYRVEFIQ